MKGWGLLTRTAESVSLYVRGISNSMSEIQDLKLLVAKLEKELSVKEKDLRVYKQELSRANEQLETLIVQVDRQLKQSQKIQRFLVPTEFPNIPGFDFSTKYKASAVAGGDYFDIFEHQDKMKFGFFLSTSSSYGMSSLFLSVLMKMTFDIEGQRKRDPAKVLLEIVKELRDQSSESDSSAIFYGVFDRRKFQLTYANMGQNLCIYHQASTGRVELLGGTPEPFSLGLEADKALSLDNEVIELQPRDKLIFCSNGFLGLKDPNGDVFGLQDILSLIKRHGPEEVHQLRNELLFRAEQFAETQNRDLTVVVVEVKDRIIKLASDRS